MKVIFLSDTAHPNSTGSIFKQLIENGHKNELASIIAKISHIAGLNGHPAKPYASPIRNAHGKLNEIRCKYIEHNLIRIYYFVDRSKNKMVLLNTTIKPDGSNNAAKYEGNSKKIIDRKIENDIQLAITLKTQYPISLKNYDPLNF